MFEIHWEHNCYRCDAPMNLSMVIREPDFEKFFRDYGSWVYMKPFDLYLNTHYYKFFGGPKVRRVCVSCFFNPGGVCIRDRETGTMKIKTREERSKTFEEVIDYFQRFSDFRKRKDIDDCIVNEKSRRSNIGLQLKIVG